jgi:hypothetical protein
MASLKKNSKDHNARKNPGSAEFFRKQRKERNAAREPQEIVTTILRDEKLGEAVHITRVRG